MFSLPQIAECFLIAVALSALCCLCSFKTLGGLQQFNYNGKNYAKWLAKKGNMTCSRFNLLAFLTLLSSATLAVAFSFTKTWAAYISLIPYPLFFALYFYADKRALKVPLTVTPRVKRIYLVEYILFIIITAVLVLGVNVVVYVCKIELISILRYLPLAIIPVLIPFVVRLANAMETLYEIPKNKKYVAAAKQKLKASNVVCIGITGSFGKTSVKNILAAMLSQNKTVLATPASYNTPLGISKFVNDTDFNDADYFIAEMGAKNVGDIKTLCELCLPQHAVITGICAQHIETFLNLDNVKKTKSELLLGTKEGGFAILGTTAKDLKKEDINLDYCVYGEDVYAQNQNITANGVSFQLVLGDEKISLKSKLLGSHNVENIALAAALAYKLGVSSTEIAAAVENLDFTPHRLQKIDADGITVLDDSYNSNIEGAKTALDVLCTFKGTKFVVTPGLVETGVLEEEINFALGEKLSLADRVILVGSTLIEPIKNGYLSCGNADNLTIVPTLNAAKKVIAKELKKGDVVLFLNDLPDVYN